MRRLAILCGLLALAVSLRAEQAKLRALILSANPETTAFLKKILEQSGRFQVTVNEEFNGLTGPTLAPYHVIILKDQSVPLQPALDGYVKSGKGLLVYGSNTGQTKDFFDVSFVDRQHPISAGMPERFIATDRKPVSAQTPAGARVLATANRQPVIWTSGPASQGRSVFTTLGGDLGSMYGEGFATTLVRGAEWAATGKVTLPANVDPFRPPENPLRVLVVTGGHSYPTSFYSLFEGHDDFVWDHAAASIEAAFKSDLRQKYDVLVLYDWYRDEPSGPVRENLLKFLESGKGVLILHHGISDFNAWQWWQEKVQGVKYFFKAEGIQAASSFKHDQDLFLVPVEPHPITKDIGPFRLIDEIYNGMWYSPEITVLLKMTSLLKDTPVAWIGPYRKSRIVYMLPGHDEKSHYHPVFRELVHRAIQWTGGRLQ